MKCKHPDWQKKNKELITELSSLSMLVVFPCCGVSQTAISLHAHWPSTGTEAGGVIPLPEDTDVSNKQSVRKDASRNAEEENDSGTS